MRELANVCKYDIVNLKRLRFHKSGKYVPDYPYSAADDARIGMFTPRYSWEDENSYNNGVQYSACGIRLRVNPFAIGKNNMREQQYIVIRRDHAEKFADACKKCFKQSA